jgi:hypothetical protein
LRVEVRVYINETRRHQSSVGIERALPGADIVTDSDNRVAIDRHVGTSRFGTRTVDDQSPTDHHIMHLPTVPLSRSP